MKRDDIDRSDRTELRRRAEDRLNASGFLPDSQTSTEEFGRMLQELSVHQIELDMQTEELQYSRDKIQNEQRRYADLYDFAPVGYLTLAPDSTILEANLTATRLLSVSRSQLKGARFGGFIAQRDLPAFNSMMNRALMSRAQEHSEVMIVSSGSGKSNSRERTFRLDGIIGENMQEYYLTLTDVTDTRVALKELKEKEELFRSMFEGHSAIMLITDPDSGLITDANKAAKDFYGWSIEELCRMHVQEIRSNRITAKTDPGKLQGAKAHFFSRHQRADGSVRDVEVYWSKIEIMGRSLIYEIVHDVTEPRHYETINAFHLSLILMEAGHSIEELLQTTIDEAELLTESSIGFIHLVGEDQKTLTRHVWSTNTSKQGYNTTGEGVHHDLDDAGLWADAVREQKAVIQNDYTAVNHRKGLPEGHAEVRREVVVPILRNDKVVAIFGVGNKRCNYDESDVKWLGLIADIAWNIVAKKMAEDEQKILHAQKYVMENMAMHDSLTGLPNRRLLSDRMGQALAQGQRNKTMVALMIFDLDNFKYVNDTFGHAVGDSLLQEVAIRMRQTLQRNTDSIARLGGDEFVVLLPQIPSIANAVASAEKIVRAMEEPFAVEGHAINISCSIGIAVYPDHGKDELTLMKHADDAMYRSKGEGGNQISVFRA